VTLDRVVRYVKRRHPCRSYLLLKDIFPQNAVDLGLMRRGGLAWRYFRRREKQLYALSDRIGCMSEANVAYVLEHNPELQPDSLMVCANSIEPLPLNHFSERASTTRTELGLPEDRVVFVYGGNLGRPQGVDFLLSCLQRLKARSDAYFVIVGSGTEYARVARYLSESGLENVQLREHLPKDEYDALLGACDVGLIFLDQRFTVPNFPSRLTAYMEAGLPVLAATDRATDIRDVLEESGSGVWVPSDATDAFVNAVDLLANDVDLRREMGDAGRAYLEEHYTVARTYDTIVAALDGPTGESMGGNPRAGFWKLVKRAFDIVVSSVLLLALSPLLLGLVFLVRLRLGSPVLFAQDRPGKGGRIFRLYKFRTMTDARDAGGELLPDDQRLAPFGRLLRSTSLDEFPEFWNVLKGDMSLVGPRPLLVQYLDRYTPEQARRHEVRPGVTGLAQVSGRNQLSWDERFELDVWYVDNMSLWLDLKILCRTLWKTVRREGITSGEHATMTEFRGNGGGPCE
jgi:lipopolysaccharide/colanic/teichoic acid biosynthesis glycosyltransferase